MSQLRQLILGAASTMGTIASGLTMGYSAIALPAMQAQEHVPAVSDSQASWIASMISIGMPVGCLAMGPIMDGLGRRKTLILMNVPSVLGWILLATAPYSEPWFFYQVYLGRLLTGLATGLVGTPIVVYVSEVLDKNLRGLVVTWPSFGFSLGILLVYILGSIFQDNWRLVAGISALFPLGTTIAVWYLIPESPSWLFTKGLHKEAEISMKRIRKVSRNEDLPDDIQQELDEMEATSSAQNTNNTWKDLFDFLKKPEAYKPLLIFNAFCFFMQFSGIYVVILYAVTIVQETGIKFDGYIVTVLIGVCRLVMSVVISYASKRYGRRFLCNTSGIGMTLFMGLFSGFLCLMHDGTISPETAGKHSWFPVLTLLMTILMGSFGFLTLPFAMLGEVFAVKIRSSACAFTTFVATVFSFIALKSFPEMRNWMGYHNVFTFYTVVSGVGTICMYHFLPETQGKTLEEIQQIFRGPEKSVSVVEEDEKEEKPSDKLLWGSGTVW